MKSLLVVVVLAFIPSGGLRTSSTCGSVSDINLGEILSNYCFKCFFFSFLLLFPLQVCYTFSSLVFFSSLLFIVLEVSISLSSRSNILSSAVPSLSKSFKKCR